MWIGQTTRSPLTAIQTESTYSNSVAGHTYSYAITGKTDGSGATFGTTYYDSISNSFSTAVGGSTHRGTINASGGATTSSTGSYTVNYPTAAPTGGSGSASGTTAGAYTTTTLTTGVSTSTITNKPGTVSTARSRNYTYPKSTVATSTKVSTQTNETAASEYTTLYGSTTTTTRASGTYNQITRTAGSITDTSRIAATTELICSAKFEVIDTAFWLNDDERGWAFTGGAGIRPINSICSEAAGSFTTAVSTTTSVRTRSVVATSASTVTLSIMDVVSVTSARSWTDYATTNGTETYFSLTDLPNSTITSATGVGTTSQFTDEVYSESFGTTGTSLVYAFETYALLETSLEYLGTQFIDARDNSGGITGFTTRSEIKNTTSSIAASSSAPVAHSGATGAAAEAEGISETITAIAEWTGLCGKSAGNAWALTPFVPSGVRVYEPFQQKSIYAQIGASGLGFTVPFEAFSIFQRDSVYSPMDTTYTTTDESAGNTRSYTVSVGTSATNDTSSFIFVTRATESTTETSTSASLYNTVELTRREHFLDYHYGTGPDLIIGGRQRDTGLELFAFEERVMDYTVVDSTTTHAGILTTNASYTASAASSNLTAFRSIPGYSAIQRGAGYSTTPKWITP